MIVHLSSEAEIDIAEAYGFYEEQTEGLGNYFRSCALSEIDSLVFHAGVHERVFGYHRMLIRKFPFAIYYKLESDEATVVAVLDARRDPTWTRDRRS